MAAELIPLLNASLGEQSIAELRCRDRLRSAVAPATARSHRDRRAPSAPRPQKATGERNLANRHPADPRRPTATIGDAV